MCHSGWDQFDTAVVCKELGCGDYIDYDKDEKYTEGPGRVLITDVGCKGWETRLKNCTQKELEEQTCKLQDSVRITCSGRRTQKHSVYDLYMCDIMQSINYFYCIATQDTELPYL